MFGDGSLTFREFVMRETLPLATIQDAMLEFLRGRTDVVLFGAQAVNAYVDEPRMTQDVDVLSLHAADFAEESRQFLADRFQIAVRVRAVANGLGHRVYQIHKPKNRLLVDVRSVDVLPTHQAIGEILVISPTQLIAQKILSTLGRKGTVKGLIDLADLHRLLLVFPDLKTADGPVAEALRNADAPEIALDLWRETVRHEMIADDDDAY